MKRLLYKRIGFTAFVLGFLMCVIYLYTHFFIVYFTGIGIREWLSSFCLSIMLILSGILLLRNIDTGLLLLNGFIFGTIIDRIIAVILYWEYIDYLFVIMPSTVALVFGVILYHPKHSRYLKFKCKSIQLAFLVILVGAIILVPKWML